MIELERFDRRRMFEGLGFASSWDFLRRDLKLLECATSRRIKSARLIGRYPAAIDRLRDGRLSMTALALLEPVIDDANAERLFKTVEKKSRPQIKKLVAELKAESVPDPNPNPTPTHTIRKAPAPKPFVASPEAVELRNLSAPPSPPEIAVRPERPEPEPTAAAEVEATPDPSPEPEQRTLFLVPSPERRAEFRPLSGDRYDISMRVSGRFVELLKEATAADGHAVPDGNPEAILTRALELLLERAGKKTGKVPVKTRTKPANPPDPNSDHIPADLLRQVFVRDNHRCVWPLASGERCDSTHRLEPDHIQARAKGGKTELSNLRILCRAHNQQWARENFGAEHIDTRIREAREARRDTKT